MESQSPEITPEDQPFVGEQKLSEIVEAKWLSLTPDVLSGKLEEHDLRSVNPGAGDILGEWLVSGGWLRKSIQLSCVLILAVIPPLLAAVEGNFQNSNLTPDCSGDLGYWNQYALALPVAILMITMYFGRLPVTLLELAKSSTFDVTLDEWNRFCGAANDIFSARWLQGVVYGISAVVTVFLAKAWLFSSTGAWFSFPDGHLAGLSMIPQFFLLYYAITFITFRIIAVYRVLKIFFQFGVNIQPLHPDGCGGLAPLGTLSMRLNVAVFLFGVIAGLGVYTTIVVHRLPALDHMNIIIVVGYLFGALVVFFLPPLAASKHMRASKNLSLKKIADRFSEINRTFLRGIADQERVDREVIEDMSALKTAHDMIARMPVLPFNIRTVSSFVGSVISAPLVLALLQPLLDAIFETIGFN